MSDQFKNYVLGFTAAARLTINMRDPFVLKKFQRKLFEVAEIYHRYLIRSSASERKQLQVSLYSLIDIIEYEDHLKRIHPLLSAQAKRALLKFYGAIPPAPASREIPEVKSIPAVAKEEPVRLSENKQKILTFLKQAPARAKDVVDEFNVLSSRTVKRSLSELISAGLVTRRNKERGVIYTAAE